MFASTRGIFGGGYVPTPTHTAIIESINISTEGNAVDFGDLSAARYNMYSAISNAHGGL